MKTVKKIWELLLPKERKRLILLLAMTVCMAMLDMLGVASILPFMAVLTNPTVLETNDLLKTAYEYSSIFGVANHDQFLFLSGIVVFVFMVFTMVFKALTTFAHIRFTWDHEYTLGVRLIERYLHQPYAWFLDRNSTSLEKNILHEVSHFVGQILIPILDCIAQGAVAFTIIGLLIFIDPKLAITVAVVFSVAYGIIYAYFGGLLERVANHRFKVNGGRFVTLGEAFGAVKEVKTRGLEQVFVNRFAVYAKAYAKTHATVQAIGLMPRFSLETIAFGGLLFVILYLMANDGDLSSALPLISLYAFAGYRLIPALQLIYVSFTRLRFGGPVLDSLYADFSALNPDFFHAKQKLIKNMDDQEIMFNQEIKMSNVQFCYPNGSRPSLTGIDMVIPSKSTVGIVGASGSGKTTLIDVILGLLDIKDGELRVDGQIVDEHNSHAWRMAIGYVPQHIYLIDNTITENIAFGIEPENINIVEVERAAKIAQIHEFITEELPQRYDTIVGERGVKLSGGQCQRIGIARALYHRPKVLIFDESTSALDSLTGRTLLDATFNLDEDTTKIIVTHRLKTVENCDIIFFMEKGNITARGTFKELMQSCPSFRAIADDR